MMLKMFLLQMGMRFTVFRHHFGCPTKHTHSRGQAIKKQLQIYPNSHYKLANHHMKRWRIKSFPPLDQFISLLGYKKKAHLLGTYALSLVLCPIWMGKFDAFCEPIDFPLRLSWQALPRTKIQILQNIIDIVQIPQ